jgi:hypothetical protein
MKTLAISIATAVLLSGCASHGPYQWQGSMLDGAPLLKSAPGTFVTPACPSLGYNLSAASFATKREREE